jgi:nucleoside-diphosphate-sugar epimerase
MKQASRSSKVLITGINGFTGIHLAKHLEEQGFDVYGTVVDETEDPKHFRCDITKKEQVDAVVAEVAPDYVVHTAAISFVGESNASLIYDVNVIGTENLLKSLAAHESHPKKVIIAGSATVYGNQGKEVLDESMCPRPVNHYGCSKLAMEHMASNFFDRLDIIITRPFNYTGPGQAGHFLIPKIVGHYRQGKKEIELGNLDVAREFNDVRDVCRIYEQLMLSDKRSEVVNLCTGRAIPLMDVIGLMNKIAGYEIDVTVNPAFVRENEIRTLKGSTAHLKTLIAYASEYAIEDTLRAMFECE